MNIRGPAGTLNLLKRRVFFAISNVFIDRSGKQPSVLQNHRIGPAQAPARQCGNILAVHQNCSGLWVVKTHEQVDERSLARSGRPHNGSQASRLRVKAQSVNDRLPRQIAKAHMLHPHISQHIGQLFCPRCIRGFRLLVNQVKNTLCRRTGRL